MRLKNERFLARCGGSSGYPKHRIIGPLCSCQRAKASWQIWFNTFFATSFLIFNRKTLSKLEVHWGSQLLLLHQLSASMWNPKILCVRTTFCILLPWLGILCLTAFPRLSLIFWKCAMASTFGHVLGDAGPQGRRGELAGASRQKPVRSTVGAESLGACSDKLQMWPVIAELEEIQATFPCPQIRHGMEHLMLIWYFLKWLRVVCIAKQIASPSISISCIVFAEDALMAKLQMRSAVLNHNRIWDWTTLEIWRFLHPSLERISWALVEHVLLMVSSVALKPIKSARPEPIKSKKPSPNLWRIDFEDQLNENRHQSSNSELRCVSVLFPVTLPSLHSATLDQFQVGQRQLVGHLWATEPMDFDVHCLHFFSMLPRSDVICPGHTWIHPGAVCQLVCLCKN